MVASAMCRIADLRPYVVTVAGLLEAETMAEICPPETRVVPGEGATRLLIPRADQSALIGLLRQLHNIGYTLLKVEADALPAPDSRRETKQDKEHKT